MTQVKAGTAIAGAMLESLAHAGCRGVFATHLHALRQLPLKLPGVEWMQMETQEERDHDTGGMWWVGGDVWGWWGGGMMGICAGG